MAKTESTMLPLGFVAPNFSLLDVVTQQRVSLNNTQKHMATVIMFICNHCPYVKHVNPELARLGLDYHGKNVRFIAISSNDIESYPDDSPEKMKDVALTAGYTFPYLYDETQEVAKAYNAACTPDFFVFDKDLKLAYRGQLDDSRPGNNIPLTGSSIRAAIDSLLAGSEVSQPQKPSIGCNIKWKNK